MTVKCVVVAVADVSSYRRLAVGISIQWMQRVEEVVGRYTVLLTQRNKCSET